MVLSPPPPPSTIDPDRDLEQRVSDLEALIEEARRRTRRRRQRNLAVVLAGAAGVGALIGFGGQGGGGAGGVATALARSSSASAVNSSPLGALPPDAGMVKSFAFDPYNPKAVYVLTVSYSAGDGEGHLYKTADGGATWHGTAAGGSGWLGGNEALAADPRAPGTLYVGTELAVYETRDGGNSWRRSTRGLFAPPRSTYDFNRDKGWVTALTIDPSDTKIVYAGSDRISKSIDGGQTWKTVFPPHPVRYPPDNVSALAIARTGPEALYAIVGELANPSATPASGRTSIYKSIDGGKTWQLSLAVRGSVAPTALAVDPRHPTTVYAAIDAKVMKTTDAGATWQPIGAGLPISATRGACHCLSQGGVKALTVDPRRYGTVYAALTQGGIYRTTNGGQTWLPVFDQPLSINTVAVDPARPATVFAAGISETGDGAKAILRSNDSGHTWASAP